VTLEKPPTFEGANHFGELADARDK
jgi:hypothetical protein